MKVSFPLQCLKMGREIRHEPFGTDLIGLLPDTKQGVLDVWSERSLSLAARNMLHPLGMIEEPHRVSTSISCRRSNLVKQGSFLRSGGLLIARCHLQKHLPPSLKTQRRFHVSSLKKKSHMRPFSQSKHPNTLASTIFCLSCSNEQGILLFHKQENRQIRSGWTGPSSFVRGNQ